MEDVRYTLVAVAFLRSLGGMLRVLFAVDAGAVQLHDGEPVVLMEVRPGAPDSSVVVEAADALGPAVEAVVAERASRAFVELVDAAFADDGTFDGGRLTGRTIELVAAPGTFGEPTDGL